MTGYHKINPFNCYIDNLWFLNAATLVFALGVFSGAFSLRYLNSDHLHYYSNIISAYIGSPSISGQNILRTSFQYNLFFYLILFCCGFFYWGYLVSFLLLVCYGASIGFSVGLLVLLLGLKGFILAVFSILPHNILLIPALLFIVVNSVTFSLSRRTKTRITGYNYLSKMFALSVLVLLACLIESSITPVFVNWIINFL
ncbi:MAG: hypothetical protein GX767_06975 [Firmicutes bacterium]|nr:hypothetical protein [Bacillota bacterium]